MVGRILTLRNIIFRRLCIVSLIVMSCYKTAGSDAAGSQNTPSLFINFSPFLFINFSPSLFINFNLSLFNNFSTTQDIV